MRIVIAGAGEVGTYLAKLLSSGNHDITVIDTDEEKLQQISDLFDLLTVQGSATSLRTLRKAGMVKADMFIALMEEEAVNITACIMSKKLGADRAIARISNREYLEDENKEYLQKLGVDTLISPEILASQEISLLLKQAGASSAFDFCGGQLSLIMIKLEPNAPIVNKSLREADAIAEQAYRAIAITRDNRTLIPRGEDVFRPGDKVYVVVKKSGVKALMDYSGKERRPVKNIMIMGGSRIGQKVARAFQEHANVKLLEVDKEKSFKIADGLNKTLVIHADGKDLDFLKSEGIQRTDAFIAVTGSTDTNILSCLLAKRMGVRQTIAEIENMDYIDLAQNMGIDTIINKKRIAASNIFSFTIGSKVSTLQYLTVTDAEVMEFDVTGNVPVTRKAVKSLNFPKGSIIGGVVRGDRSFIATGDTQIQSGDKVVVFSLPEALEAVIKFF